MPTTETPAAALLRLRREGRWDEARAWQEAERQRLGAEGVPKDQARTMAYNAMLAAFPAAAVRTTMEAPSVPDDFWDLITLSQFPPRSVPSSHLAFGPVWVGYCLLSAELACREVETAENRERRWSAVGFGKAHFPREGLGLIDLTESAPLLFLQLAKPLFEQARDAVDAAGDEFAAYELDGDLADWPELERAVREHWPACVGQ